MLFYFSGLGLSEEIYFLIWVNIILDIYLCTYAIKGTDMYLDKIFYRIVTIIHNIYEFKI